MLYRWRLWVAIFKGVLLSRGRYNSASTVPKITGYHCGRGKQANPNNYHIEVYKVQQLQVRIVICH